MHVLAFFHVENVARDQQAVEVEEEVEVEFQEQQQEFVESDQVEDPDLEANFANFDPQQGKPRFIYPRVLHKFKFYASPGSF